MTTEALAEKKRRIAIRPAVGGQWCICDDWAGVDQMIEDPQHGDGYEIRFYLMTDAEVEALGDFDGW